MKAPLVTGLAAGTDHDLAGLVRTVCDGDPSGVEDLYRMFSAGVRSYLRRQLGDQDLDDTVHHIFRTIVESIRRGELKEPARLIGHVRGIVKWRTAEKFEHALARSRAEMGFGLAVHEQQCGPERRLIADDNTEKALRILNTLYKRDREVLIRFYLRGQSAEAICRDLRLTLNQFRRVKSRAKARFRESGIWPIANRRAMAMAGVA